MRCSLCCRTMRPMPCWPGASGGPMSAAHRSWRSATADLWIYRRCFPPCAICARRPIPPHRCAPRVASRLAACDTVLANTPVEHRDRDNPWLLSPIDLHAIKAAGVTFVVSMIERVIEERARGDLNAAVAIRAEVNRLVGDDLTKLKPGSPEAAHLKQVLIEQNAWSQYLEVGIGPDAEIFTKAQPMAAVGTGMDAGIHPKSSWNNPEPEVVLAVTVAGRIVAATLGNDVNLRDVEGRSALCSARRRTTTHRVRSARSCASSMPGSRWMISGRRRSPSASKDPTASGWRARRRSPGSAATHPIWWRRW